jgi:hypothetical protein
MHTLENVDHSKGNPRLARRTRSVKAKPVAGLERTAKTPIAFIGTGKHSDSATGPKNIRCRGRSLGTCFDEILPDSKRGHKEFVLLGPPLSGRHRQTRMQTRLSARSSGFVESVGSSGGSDSELIQCADDTEERLQKKNLLAGTISLYRPNGIFRSVGTSLQHRMS